VTPPKQIRGWRAPLLIAALLVAGCGGDDEADRSAAPTKAASSAFPVTVSHALGSTTIPAEPKRVVVVGYTDHETLLALGVRPVGAMDWFGQGTYGKWPWERRAWGGKPAQIVSNKSYEIDFEKVAALRPDLIVGTYADLKRNDYDKLSQIAPTVAQGKGDAYTTPWRDMTRVIAKAVGRVAQGEKLIAGVDAQFAAFRKAHPEVAGQEALVVDAGQAPKSYYPFASADPRGQFLAELGYKGSPGIDKLVGHGFGAEVAKERVDLLDVDRLFLLIDEPARKRLDADALFNRLDVAKSRRVTPLGYYSGDQLGAAVAFNSVLSIPYALKGIAAQLGEQTASGSVPKRVVALDFPSADAVIALGVTPIAIGKVSYVPGGVQAWTKAALGARTPKLIDAETQVPLEEIAALHPDLIVATNAYNLGPVRSKLEKLAPVVTWKHGAGVDTWQESTLLVGEALHREAKARQLVADTESRVARAREEHPAFVGKTVTLFNYYQGTAWAISSPDDFSIRFLSSLGFKLAPEIERRKGKDGRLEVSNERVSLLDADVVLGTSSDSAAKLRELTRGTLFQRLSAVKRDAYSSIDIGPATSIAFPSALSVNYAVDELVPLLDRLTAQ
jgi:iron-siderophore transport system substrate-binding protein